MPIIDYTGIGFSNGHKTIGFTGACGVLGPDDLRLECNTLTGVTMSDDSAELHIPEYYEAVLINPCTGVELTSGYKEDFYLTYDGLEFPYYYNARDNQIENWVQSGRYYNSAEWDSLSHYGIPDTMLAFAQIIRCDPYDDCATCITKGRSDIYNNNDDLIIDSIPDGTYILKIAINLPATVYDPGVYPNYYQHLCKITGNVFEWTDIMPICCNTDAIPYKPTGLDIQRNVLRWDPIPNTTSYKIYRALAYQAPGGWTVGNQTPVFITEVINTNLTLPTTANGWYFYFVSAKNCAGESQTSMSKKVKQ